MPYPTHPLTSGDYLDYGNGGNMEPQALILVFGMVEWSFGH